MPLSKLDYFFYKFSDKRSEHKNGDNGDNKKENDDGKKENGDDKRKKFMFYKYIRKNYNRYDHNSYDKFQNDIRTYFELQDDISPFEKQMIIQIVDLAGIANTKFVLFSCGLLMELIAIIILAFSLVVA